MYNFVHTNDVFDDFPKISEHFSKISEYSLKVAESERIISEHSRKIPKITEDFRGRTDDVSIILEHL